MSYFAKILIGQTWNSQRLHGRSHRWKLPTKDDCRPGKHVWSKASGQHYGKLLWLFSYKWQSSFYLEKKPQEQQFTTVFPPMNFLKAYKHLWGKCWVKRKCCVIHAAGVKTWLKLCNNLHQVLRTTRSTGCFSDTNKNFRHNSFRLRLQPLHQTQRQRILDINCTV